jgi:hypothetical protein
MNAAPKKLSRVARGKRPQILNTWSEDVLLAMVTSLTTELMVLRDRVDTIERIAADKGVILKDEIENYTFDEKAQAERDAARKALGDRVYYLLLAEAERHKAAKAD